MTFIRKYINIYSNLSKPIKAAIWFTVCNFLLKGISFISAPIFTRLLSEAEYGKLSVYMSYEQLAVIFATWEIHLGAYQKGIFKYKDNIKSYTSSTLLVENIINCCFFSIIFIFSKKVSEFTEMPLWILVILFIYILLMPAYQLWMIRKRTYYEYKSCVAITLLYSLISVIVPVLSLKNISATANIKFAATLISSSVINIIFFIPCLRKRNIKGNFKEYSRFNIGFSAPLVLHSLSFLILAQADRVMIKEFIGETEAAYYSVAYSLASAVVIFQNSIYQAIKPWQYNMLENGKASELKKNIMPILFFIAYLIVIFTLAAPEVFKVMFTPNYYEAIWCIAPIAAGVFFMFLYSLFVNIEEYYEKTKHVAFASVICSLVNIALNYIFINLFGYIAAAYTTLISYILLSIMHYMFMKKALLLSGTKENVVDIKKLLFISIAVVVISIGASALSDYLLLRFLILLVIIIVSCVKRKSIIRLLKMLKQL